MIGHWIGNSTNPHRKSAFARVMTAAVAVVLLYGLSGCADDPGGDPVDNLHPKVWLSSAPPEGNSTKYRVHLFWGGWDPDGEIAYYEYSITNNDSGTFDPADTTGADNWNKVFANDSLFTLTADLLVDPDTEELVTRFERSHTFFIRAIDEQGLASKEPAYRSFTSWTLSPQISITVPRSAGLTPALVPSIATYRWTAKDFVNTEMEIQDPDSVRWILHSVENNDFVAGADFVRQNQDSEEWSDWHHYGAPDDSGKFWTTPPTDLGTYVFAVQAKDEAGAVTPVFDERHNVRRIRVSRRSTGPLLDLYNEYIGTVRTSVVNSPPVILDMPAGVPMQFKWSGDAEGYGGLVSGYRYGWDIGDLDDPDQWEIDFTPFTSSQAVSPPRTFFFGTHTFDIEIVDNSGAKSRVEVKVNVIQFSMDRSLLYVDDFEPKGAGLAATGGAMPNDDEHDAFWVDMLRDVANFNFQDDAITVRGGEPVSIVKFANYKSVIWNALGGYNVSPTVRPKLYDLIQFRSEDPDAPQPTGKVQPNLLALFVRAGGHLLLCGNQPMTQVISTEFYQAAVRYPFIFKYELEGDQDGNYSDQVQTGNFVGDLSFAYRDACLNAIDIAYAGYSGIRNTFDHGCGVKSEREPPDPKNNGLREALPLDPAYPLLQLRDEVAGVGKAFHEDKKGLNAEMYNSPYFDFCLQAELGTPRDCFTPVYGNGCLNPASAIYNAPIAFWSGAYAHVVPEAPDDGVAARSFYMGVEPFFFVPSQVKGMMDMILFDEWQLQKF